MLMPPIKEKLISVAMDSNVKRSKMAALIVTKNGHICCFAPNMSIHGTRRFTIHAEEFVLAKAIRQAVFKRYNLRDLSLIVGRYKPATKKLSLAKPCKTCQRLIKEAKITCYYTTDNQTIERLR